MKLKNKETGEIVDLDMAILKAQFGGISVIPKPHLIYGEEYVYSSLAELCKEWEDYEESKEYWYIDEWGNIQDTDYYNDQYDNAAKEIGNKFETKEEAEKAVEKLKALERLKDKGFKFSGFAYTELCDYARVNIKATMINDSINDDLELLFGGEE